MTPDEHARLAEGLIADARDLTDGSADYERVANVLRMAQVHATLSLRQPALAVQPALRPASPRTAEQRAETGLAFRDAPTVAAGDTGDSGTGSGFQVDPGPTIIDVGSTSALDHKPQRYGPGSADGEAL